MSKALEEARRMEVAAIALRKELEEKERANMIQLCTAERGRRIIGNAGNEYIVLKQIPSEGQTMIISADFMAENVVFDENTTYYAESDLKERIEEDILPVVGADFGADNIVDHEVDLTTVDMQVDFGTCKCKVRPITFDEAREFNDLLVKEDLQDLYWTCTPWSIEKRGWKYSMAVVSPSGGICYGNCGGSRGVRPFCILKSLSPYHIHPFYIIFE